MNGMYFWYGGTALAAYLIGSVPFGFLIGRLYGHDLRKEGSGNIGATNVTRVIGGWAGKICFLLDFAKGLLPVLACTLLPGAGAVAGLTLVAVCGTVLGHIFPLYLHFRGGKGIATAAGALTALAPLAVLAAFLVWVVVFLASRYVSLGSIVAAAVLPFFAWGFSRLGWNPLPTADLIFFAVLAVLAILKHQSNVRRLLNGTENRFERKSSHPESKGNR